MWNMLPKMMISLIVCVILFANQVEMKPIEDQEKFLDITKPRRIDLALNLKEVQSEGATKMAADHKDIIVEEILFRLKRDTLGNYRCPDGEVPLWFKGPCVSCDEYMERKDTEECPT